MPLIHSKKPAAFKENIRKEVHAGKPVKQAVAIAYSEKAKAEHKKHLDSGGKVDGCPMCMGGEYDDGGQVSGAQSFQDSFRKATHYDEGGRIDEREQKASHEMKYKPQVGTVGVHQGGGGEGELKGRSAAGITAEWGKKHKTDWHREGATNKSKEFHSNKLEELRSMPNPNIKGLADGGEVESYEGSPEDEIQDMLGQELMNAVHSKDHKKLMSGLEAMIMSCLNKRED